MGLFEFGGQDRGGAQALTHRSIPRTAGSKRPDMHLALRQYCKPRCLTRGVDVMLMRLCLHAIYNHNNTMELYYLTAFAKNTAACSGMTTEAMSHRSPHLTAKTMSG